MSVWGQPVTASGIAHTLGVSSPSVSAAARHLERAQLLLRPPRGGWRLTPRGELAASAALRRHRLMETFLARTLDLGWDEVHAEAERLEYGMSETLTERIDTALGHPTHDPHGYPIPPRRGPHTETLGPPLSTAPAGSRFLIEQVSDRDSAALRYLAGLGVHPGVILDVEAQDPFGGPRWVCIGGARHALAASLTTLLRGHVLPTPDPTAPGPAAVGPGADRPGAVDGHGPVAGGEPAGVLLAPAPGPR